MYCLAADWHAADTRGRHLLRAHAVVRSGGGVLSHVSAAACHGLPLPLGESPIWVTRPPGSPTRNRDGVMAMAATVPPGHVVTVAGLPVTSAARTVADCLRHLSRADAVAIGDAALRAQPRLLPDVLRVLDRCEQWPYVERARSALHLLDGRRGSPLESQSFVAMVRGQVPLPAPQVVIRRPDGVFVARVDFWWPEFAVAGEADGLVKYDVSGRTPEEARRALIAEKEREDRLRSLGVRVVRWGTRDLQGAGWSSWLVQQLALGDPSGFRGVAAMPGALEAVAG